MCNSVLFFSANRLYQDEEVLYKYTFLLRR